MGALEGNPDKKRSWLEEQTTHGDCASHQQMVAQPDRAVFLHPCTNGMIRAFFGRWREEDTDSFKLRRKTGLSSHLLTPCSIQKGFVEYNHRHCYWFHLCLKIKGLILLLLKQKKQTKTSFRKMILLERGFWSQDPEQCLHTAQSRLLGFGKRICLLLKFHWKIYSSQSQTMDLDFILAGKVLKCEVLHDLVTDNGPSSCVWPVLFPCIEKKCQNFQ